MRAALLLLVLLAGCAHRKCVRYDRCDAFACHCVERSQETCRPGSREIGCVE